MASEIKRDKVLSALLDTLYEEYRDDLPSSLRLIVNLLRQLAAKMSGDEARALQSATKADVEEAWQQSKLATEYSAKSWLGVTEFGKALEELRKNDLPALADKLDDIKDRVEKRNASETDIEATRRIERALELRNQSNTPEARAHLEIARRELWPNMSGHNRYRVLAELGLCDDHDGYHQAAAMLLLEAKQHDPDNPRAKALGAYALLALDEIEKAHSNSEKLLQDNPSLDVAAQVWILSSPPDTKFSTVESHILPAVRDDSGVAIALAKRAADEELDDTALQYVRVALKESPESINILSVSAQILFNIMTKDGRHIRASSPLTDPQGLLNEALEHINRALNLLGSQGPPLRVAALHTNRSLIYSALGHTIEARRDLEYALTTAPDDEDTRLAYWRYLFSRKEFQKAIEVTDPALQDKPSRILLFPHAVSLYAMGGNSNRNKAVEVARQVHKMRPQMLDDTAVHAVDLIVDIECELNRYEEARKALDEVKEVLPPGHAEILQAEIYKAEGEDELAGQMLHLAVQRISPGTDRKMSFRLVQTLIVFELDELALPHLKAISPPDCVGPLTHQLLECAYRCTDKEFIKEYCGNLRNNGYIDAGCLELELQVYEDLGATSEIITAIQESLHADPPPANAPSLRLWLSIAGLRLGREELIEKDISQLPAASQVDARMGALVADVLRRSKRDVEALVYAYTVFRNHPSAEVAHQSIISVAMLARDTNQQTPRTVAPGVAVLVTDETESNTYWRIIEDENNPKPDLYRNELPPDDALALALVNVSADESVVLDGASGKKRTLKVRELADKRKYRASECLRQFELNFPTSNFIRKIKAIDESTGKPDFTEMIKVLKEHDQHAETVLDHYEKLPACSIYFAAKRAGDTLPAFIERIGSSGRRYRCCQGSHEERQRALKALCLGLGIVIDPSALLTLFLSESVEILSATAVPIVVSEATYIWLHEFRESLFGDQSSRHRVGLHSGELAAYEWSEEAVKKASDDIGTMLKFLESRVQSGFVLAKHSVLDQETIRDVLGMGAVQSIALAADRGYILWTDDFTTGMLARNELSIERVWTQIFANDSLVRGAIDAQQYYDLSFRLIVYRYWFTSLDLQMIQYAFEQADYDPDRWPANMIWKVVGEPDTNLPNLDPLFSFLITQMQKRDDIEPLIMRLLYKLRGRPGGDQILNHLHDKLPSLCGLDVLRRVRIDELIKSVVAVGQSQIVLPSPYDIFRFGRRS